MSSVETTVTDQVRVLAAAEPGLRQCEIAHRLGIDRRRVFDALRYRCERCGELSSAGTSLCIACENQRRAARTDELVELVATLYNAGSSYREIVAELGWAGKPGRLVALARERGLIGYRYAACERRAAA